MRRRSSTRSHGARHYTRVSLYKWKINGAKLLVPTNGRGSVRFLPVVLMVILAGCTQPPAEAVPVESLVTASEADQPVYRFTLHARSIENNPQEVTFRIYVNGFIRAFVEWPEDARTSDYEILRAFEVPGGAVTYDIVIDGNVINGASMDISECPNGRGDAFVRVEDVWRARSDYGCHVDGYTPSE